MKADLRLRRDGLQQEGSAGMKAADVRHVLYWTGHIMRHSPGMAWPAVRVAVPRHTFAGPDRAKILIGTHHKVLTVFLGRVFRTFAALTARSYDRGMGKVLNYEADVLIDHHSTFQFDWLTGPWKGLHVVRDPRDVLVSAANYHTRSSEPWLHRPDEKLGGRTYQDVVKSLPTLEDRMLFELDHVVGEDIAAMLAWDYARPGMLELRYENLVGPDASRNFADATAQWGLPPAEHDLLVRLFDYFSIGKPGTKGNAHIRNAAAGQWAQHFTPAVTARFEDLFPGAAERLGYAPAVGAAA